MLKSDLVRRVGALEDRVAWLDQHGTRGVESIRAVQTEQASDLGEIKATMAALSDRMSALTGRQWQRVAGFALAIIPVYVLLFLAVFRPPGGH